MIDMVTIESVEQACSEVSEYSDERMATEFERFFEEEPAVCEFVIEATSSSGTKVREFSLFLTYMVFKAARINNPAGNQPVTAEAIDDSCRECEHWMEQIQQTSEAELSENTSSAPRDDEPHLVRYVISELNEPLDEDGELEDDERGEVFFVLKTVIGTLSRKTHEIKDS
jgi:hypothetical protein